MEKWGKIVILGEERELNRESEKICLTLFLSSINTQQVNIKLSSMLFVRDWVQNISAVGKLEEDKRYEQTCIDVSTHFFPGKLG